MKNIKGDIIWGTVLLSCLMILIIPASRELFISLTSRHPYLLGFVKFFVLATMGDLIGIRILQKKWIVPKHLIFKASVWGVIGIFVTLAMTVYMGGVLAAQEAGKLPFPNHYLVSAFFASLTMNATFGPMLYIYHKSGDYIVDRLLGDGIRKVNAVGFAQTVDWLNMVCFFWLKTCPLIWLPVHTLVFLLPPAYRVVASAFLSILLGIVVALSKKQATDTSDSA